MLRNKHLKLQAQQVIMNVLHYFERERDNGGCHVTVATLKREVSEAGVFNFSSASLTRLLHSIGFSFTKDDGRRGLYELDHIASSRVRFLRDYNTNIQSKDYDPVFLDETWIFSRGSPKKSWHDNTLKSIKKKPMGEGKRFSVLNAGSKDLGEVSHNFSSIDFCTVRMHIFLN
ncbi:hypothetical protein FQA39_LY10627 [Lamprigera yunnana]|nr:hypothetical protein FQA39_LY10627 [Lamprigera yunnana]